MRIGVISAMDSEHSRLVQELDAAREWSYGRYQFTEGELGDNTLCLTRCGIGKVNAALGTSALIRHFAPECIVSTGVAGGVDDVLQVTDVVAGAQVAYHDVWCGPGNAYGQVQGLPTFFEAPEALVCQALALNGAEGVESRIHEGLICTGDQFITRREELEAIKARFPQALAVDMESAAIAQTCFLYRMPFISFRIISDTPGADHHQQQYEGFWNTVADRSFRTTVCFLRSLSSLT